MQIQEIAKRGIVAVIRNARLDTISAIAQALEDGGVTAFEITMETPNALRIIELLRSQCSEEVVVGAGTVLDAETARAAILSGAQFVFSPTVNRDTIKLTKRYGVLSVPGAMTPTEILNAYEAGADIVKVFPANVLGPQYLKAIAGPLPHIPLMPTGGIGIDNMENYMNAGAIAVGVGSTLVDGKNEITSEGLLQLTEKAHHFMNRMQKSIQYL